jgi:hypothetical protein
MSSIILSDSYGNLIRVTHFAISTGDKSGFYTLRAFGNKKVYTKTEFGVEESSEPASVYLKNLSTEKEKALKSARRFLSSRFPAESVVFRGVVNFDLDEIHRISREESERRAAAEAARIASTDFSVFQGGKHAGKTVTEVAAEDKSYLIWFAGQSFKADSDSARTQQFAKALLAPEQEVAAKAVSSRLEALKQEIGADTLEAWYEGQGGAFLRSIANDLKQGTLPRGRGLSIVLEILAKWAGRSGSKAFNARLAELEAKFI